MADIDYGSFKDGMHVTAYPVYYEDTDAAGVVYYANYLKFAERARTDALRAMGISQAALLAGDGLGFVVKRVTVDYKQSARLDDVITVQTRLRERKKVRMTMEQRILRKDTLLTDLVVDIAMIDHHFTLVRIPGDIADTLDKYLTVT